jgi:hypothetical protein
VFRARVIENESRLEVIEGVKDKIDILYVVFDIGGIHIVDNGLDLNTGIDSSQFLFRSLCLGKVPPDILFIVERLPLQVRCFDEVAVNDTQPTHARARQQFR